MEVSSHPICHCLAIQTTILTHEFLLNLYLLLRTGKKRIVNAGLMTLEQYNYAKECLFGRMQLMQEREGVHVDALLTDVSDGDDGLDEKIVRTISTYCEKAMDEFRIFCNIVKAKKKHFPKAYVGTVLKLGSIEMGKVGVRGTTSKQTTPLLPAIWQTTLGTMDILILFAFSESTRIAFRRFSNCQCALPPFGQMKWAAKDFSVLLGMSHVLEGHN
jgi:hypothetical protein